MKTPLCRLLSYTAWLLLSAAALAANPTVSVSTPSNNVSVTSPVHYVATATSNGCSGGIAAIRIYSAPGVSALTVTANSPVQPYRPQQFNIDNYITLQNGTYNTVVQAWDNCGGVGKACQTIIVTGQTPPQGFVFTTATDWSKGGTNNINNVYGFRVVQGAGALAPTGQGPVKANVAPMSVASDLGGYRLYVGDFASGDVFAYFIDRRYGYIYPVPGSPFPVNRSVTAVAVHPSGKFVFAAASEESAGDGVAVFEVQSDGSLKEVPGSPFPTQNGPDAISVDPGGKYLYVANASYSSTLKDSIDAFEIDTNSGALTPLPGSPYQLTTTNPNCEAFPTDLIDYFGKTVYTANAFDQSISAFSLESATGALSQVAGSPFPDVGGCHYGPPPCDSCIDNPQSIAVGGSGLYLYAVNTGATDMPSTQ
ncbi:MAG: lactonase family protein [Terriglobales bacterium]